MKRVRIIAAVCLMLLLLVSCSETEKEEDPMPTPSSDTYENTIDISASEDSILEQLAGDWYDVNGDTVITFAGDVLTLRFSDDWQEDHSIILVKDGSSVYVKPADENDYFDVMSYIQVREDRLTAYEEVLDADGHSFVFVRQSALEDEQEIKDLSKDLPKEIESHEITSFSLSFTLDGGRRYDADDCWESGTYSWEIEKEDGVYEMTFSVSGDSYIIMDEHPEVTEEFMRKLDLMIRSEDILSHNGYHFKNNVSANGYSLYVEYESGEEVRIIAQGNAADTCIFSIQSFLDLAGEVIEREE